jgi:hypothetical protein
LGKDDTTIILVVGGLALVGGAIIFWPKIQEMLDGMSMNSPLTHGDIGPSVDPNTTPTGKDTSGKCTPVDQKTYIDYYATRVAEELDKYQQGKINRTTKLNIKGNVLLHYKSELSQMFSLNGGCIITLEGKPLGIFSNVVIKAAGRQNIVIPSDTLKVLQQSAKSSYVRSYHVSYKNDPSLLNHTYHTIRLSS